MRLGTRQSALALTQSGMVARALGPDVTLVGVTTEGDRLVDVPLRGALTKGFFTEALEAGLRDGSLDLAVHSLKDLPVADPEGLVVAATPERASVADLLLVRPDAWDEGARYLPLRAGARVGAASERRQSLLRALRPDTEPAFLRGNVPTRVERLREGRYDAIVLAEAGITRLGLDLAGLRVARLTPLHWPCAAGQGALGVQCRADNTAVRERISAIDDADTAFAVATERGWLARLGGGCAVPFGAAVWRSSARTGAAAGEPPGGGGALRGAGPPPQELDWEWALGLAKDGVFRIRRGVGIPAGTAALDALLDGAEGEAWPERIWEDWHVEA
jgi:hydroxymethylbilane synthase